MGGRCVPVLTACCSASVCWQAQYGWSPPVGSTVDVTSNTPANRLRPSGTLSASHGRWGGGGGQCVSDRLGDRLLESHHVCMSVVLRRNAASNTTVIR